MVLGLLTIAAGIPTTIGVAQAVSAHNNAERDKKLSQKCNLLVYCDAKSRYTKALHLKPIWLCNDKMYVSEGPPEKVMKRMERELSLTPKKEGGTGEGGESEGPSVVDPGHAFEGFYINFPREPDKPMGLVSMSSKAPPAMGWIYVDRDTREVRYGKRSSSLPHIVGTFGWTKDEIGVTLNGIEAFVVIEEEEGVWAVYWDKNGDGKGLPKDKTVLEISLERRPVEDEELKTGDSGVKTEGKGLGGEGKIKGDGVAKEKGGKTKKMKT